jgi:hypothetical protein
VKYVELIAADIRSVGSKVVINGTAKVLLTYTVTIIPIRFGVFESRYRGSYMDLELFAPECGLHCCWGRFYTSRKTTPEESRGFSGELHVVAQVSAQITLA